MIDTNLFQVYCNNKKITLSITDGLVWGSDESTLGTQLTFSYAQTDVSKKLPIDAGDIVVMLYAKKKIFTGVVVDISLDSRNPRNITCLDFAFYLNKSDTTIQFKNSPADESIRRLLSKYPNIKLQIDKIPLKITKIYKAKTYSEIIKDILDIVKTQTGVSYVFEMDNQTLVIRKKSDLTIKINTSQIINPQRKISIQEMKNSVDVVLSGEKSFKVLATSENNTHIKKYGLLKEIHEIEKEEVGKAKNIANKLLSELDKVAEETSVDFLGDVTAKAGRILRVVEPITGISGIYLIKNASHNISSASYMMNLKLEKVR